MVDFIQASQSTYGMQNYQQQQHSFLSSNNYSASISSSSHDGEFDMELTYITENLIALSFPDDGSEVTYRQNAKEVSDMLKAKHGDKYAVVNLSRVSHILEQNNPQVLEFGFPAHLAPPLEALCSICRMVASWLQTSSDHVVVFHCKGGIDRLACVLAAYINYSSIYGGEMEALNRMAMKQFFEEQLGKWLQPSQNRYVRYFSQLLTGELELRSEPVYLQHIMLHSIPKLTADGNCQLFVKIYSNMKPVYTSAVLKVSSSQQRICVSLTDPLELSGDVLVKLYNKKQNGREAVCRLQFNSSTINSDGLMAGKHDLDDAASDQRFADNGRVELIFTYPDSQTTVQQLDFSNAPKDDPIVHWDSYEDFSKAIDHSPLDSPSGKRKSVRVSRYFEDGPVEDSLYTKSQAHTTNMPAQMNGDLFTSSIPGSEYGITNVSSKGKVAITVIPPKLGGYAQQLGTTSPRALSPTSPRLVNSPRYLSSSDATTTVHTSRTSSSNNGVTGSVRGHDQVSQRNPRTTVTSSTVHHPRPPRSPVKASSPRRALSGNEQNDLDEILRELLGDSHTSTTTVNTKKTVGEDSYTRDRKLITNPDGSTTTIERRVIKAPDVTERVTINKSQHVSTQKQSQNSVQSPAIDPSGATWLEQQQWKLNQRQRSRDTDDVEHRRAQEKQLVSELKTVQTRRKFSSSDHSEHSSDGVFRTQKDIVVQQQPVAYTVLIKPEEQKRIQEEQRQNELNQTNLTKRSVTNVSHTHHTHYNFKDAGNDEVDSSLQRTLQEQKDRIAALEAELRNVKVDLENTQKREEVRVESKPPRPPKAEVEEEEMLSFKPVGIANLESGSGGTLPRVIPGPQPTTTSMEEEEVFSFKPVGVSQLDSGSGQTHFQTNTMKTSHSSYGGTQGMSNGMGTMNGGMGSMRNQPQSPGTPMSNFPVYPATPYQVMSPASPAYRTLHMRQLRQSAARGYNMLGRSHDNLSQHSGYPPPSPHHFRRQGYHHEPLRRHASASVLPRCDQPGYRGSAHISPVVRISGDFEDMWSRQAVGTLHKPVYGREFGAAQAPQRTVTESSRHVQQSWSGGGTSPMGGPGVMNPGNQQQGQQHQGMQQSGGHSSYGHTSHHQNSSGYNMQNGGMSPSAMPHNQALHVNTAGSEAKYATIGNTASSQGGHVHFTNGEQSSGMMGYQQGYGRQQSSYTGLRSPSHSMYPSGGVPHYPGPPSVYHGAGGYGSRRGSFQSLAAASDAFLTEQSHVTAKFVKDTSRYWYKPSISRDEAINMLREAQPGTFVVRDSNSFPGAFGLALKVAHLPPNVHVKNNNDISAEYVRFYLIEPTAKGVKLKGCSNEPVFASLAALIYQHTITPMALPCRLVLPDPDRVSPYHISSTDQVDGAMGSPGGMNTEITSSAAELLRHGAACSVVYLNNVDTESLTGPQAVSRAVQQTFSKGVLESTIATFKVSNEGITVTDTNRKLFFRHHYPKDSVSFCGLDPADRRFSQTLDNGMQIREAKMFGFVAKKKGGNHCLLFAEMDPEQPASAVVNFVTKVMMNK